MSENQHKDYLHKLQPGHIAVVVHKWTNRIIFRSKSKAEAWRFRARIPDYYHYAVRAAPSSNEEREGEKS